MHAKLLSSKLLASHTCIRWSLIYRWNCNTIRMYSNVSNQILIIWANIHNFWIFAHAYIMGNFSSSGENFFPPICLFFSRALHLSSLDFCIGVNCYHNMHSGDLWYKNYIAFNKIPITPDQPHSHHQRQENVSQECTGCLLISYDCLILFLIFCSLLLVRPRAHHSTFINAMQWCTLWSACLLSMAAIWHTTSRQLYTASNCLLWSMHIFYTM